MNEETNENIISLSNIEKELTIEDINKELKYRRVIRPDNIDSDYFELFFRDKVSEEIEIPWNIKNGLLSKLFTVVKTEHVLNEIVNNLNSSITYRKDFSYLTYSKIDFVLNGVSSLDQQIEPDTKLNDLMFKLITDINPEEINSSTQLSFAIVNAFGGEHALFMSYGLLTTFTIKDDTGKIVDYNINNLLLMADYSKKLIHNNSLELEFSDITDIKTKLIEKIQLYRSINITEEVIELLKKGLTKKLFNSFMSVFTMLADDFHNLFYISYIFSSIISSDSKSSLVTINRINKVISDIIIEFSPVPEDEIIQENTPPPETTS